MAEQVVDIRQRIERMRTQIDDGASPSQDNSKPNEKVILKKGNLENQKDLRPSDKNTSDNFLKKSDSLENKKTEFDGSKVKTPNFKNVESLNENMGSFWSSSPAGKLDEKYTNAPDMSIARGSGDKSYGIQVAKLAGLPLDVVKRAEQNKQRNA